MGTKFSEMESFSVCYVFSSLLAAPADVAPSGLPDFPVVSLTSPHALTQSSKRTVDKKHQGGSGG